MASVFPCTKESDVSTDRRAVAVPRPLSEGAEPGTLNRLVPIVYDDLVALATRLLHAHRTAHALQPTDLVHEAYIRLLDQRAGWHDGGHVVAVAARTMRRVLADDARSHRALKRGGTRPHVSLDATINPSDHGVGVDEVLEVDEALSDLRFVDTEDARVVALRCYGGLTVREAARVMRVSPATVKRRWTLARTWLCHRLYDSRH